MAPQFCVKQVLSHQLKNLLPFGPLTQECFENILLHAEPCVYVALDCLRFWRDFQHIQQLDPTHSRQYGTFLAILSRHLYQKSHYRESEIVAYLNKVINGLEIYGHVPLPSNFLMGHTLGIVLGRAVYGNYLCIQHNVTIGRWNDDIPQIHDRVMVMNGALIAGKSIVGENSIVSAGVKVINQVVPPNTIAFGGYGRELVIKPNKHNYIDKFLSNATFGLV